MANVLRLDPRDNVAVALSDLDPDTIVELDEGNLEGLVTRQTITFGHKVALTDISSGEQVIKYGASIGVASQAIARGEHVHVHNLKSVRGAAK